MSYYPIFLELEGKEVLVVGGGRVAQRKVEGLIEYGATVHIVSRDLTEKLKDLVRGREVFHTGEAFMDKHLDGIFLVFAATDDNLLNHHISEVARKRGLLVNAVDQPEDCNFIVPAVLRKGDFSIAVSTSGKSPAFAKHIRKQLDRQFGEEYETFLILMGRLRRKVLLLGLSQQENSRIFHELVHSNILNALAQNDMDGVKVCLAKILPEDVIRKDILNDL